jgi:hypothetical protein
MSTSVAVHMALGKAGRSGRRHGHGGGDGLLHHGCALVVHAGNRDCGWGTVCDLGAGLPVVYYGGGDLVGVSGSSRSNSSSGYRSGGDCTNRRPGVDDGGRSFQCGRGAGG